MHAVKLIMLGVVGALLILGLTPAGASSANISHAYNSFDSLTTGSLASLDPVRSDYVELANTDNASKLVGVVVAADDSLLAVDAAAGKVQIATSGTATTLVSTLEGDIKVGDQIAVSPFGGIGMKAFPGSHVIGLAQTGFNSRSEGATSRQVIDKQGKSTKIMIGYVRLTIGIGTASAQGSDAQLNSIQKFTKSVTGRTVSTFRALLSLGVALVACMALLTLIYASIYGSIISIGRNPLAKYAVFRTLGSVLAMAAMTAGVAGLTIFLLIR